MIKPNKWQPTPISKSKIFQNKIAKDYQLFYNNLAMQTRLCINMSKNIKKFRKKNLKINQD